MLGAGLQCNRNRSDGRFYNPAKARRNCSQSPKNSQVQRTQSDVGGGGLVGETSCIDNDVVFDSREPEYQTERTLIPAALPAFHQVQLPLSNMERFLEAITPSVPAQYLSKTTMRGWRACDVKFQPYFMLSDLWESFKEWSAYGAGVPLVLNGSDSVVQYYVPYLSGLQLYVDRSKSLNSRRNSEDSDADFCSRDSGSDGSSDSERERDLAYSSSQRNQCSHPSDIHLKLNRLLLGDQNTVMQEGFLSDEGESGNLQGDLLFEYLEHDPPYGREPLTDKIYDLALRFPELTSLRSCDLLPSSWISVAWYPIYRIPMGPTLKDLDACFLTFHSLYTPIGDAPPPQSPVVVYPDEIDGIPRISLPVFGLASYKFRGSLWTSNSGSDCQLVTSLLKKADSWLGLLQVNHPDYVFFSRNRICP